METGIRVAQDTPHLCPTLHLFFNFSVRLSIGELKRQQKLEKYKLPWGNEPVSLTLPSFCGVLSLGMGIDLNNNHKRGRLSIVYPPPPPTTTSPVILASTGTLHSSRFSSPHETNNHSPHSPQSQEKKTVNNLGTALLQPYIPLVTICRGKYSFSLFWSTAYFFSSTMVM